MSPELAFFTERDRLADAWVAARAAYDAEPTAENKQALRDAVNAFSQFRSDIRLLAGRPATPGVGV